MFVLAEVVCGASPIPYASLRTHGVVQQIHWKKCRWSQDLAYERKSRFRAILVTHFGVKFGVSVALRALSGTNSNYTSGS